MTTFYVDPIGGLNTNDGLSKATAKKSVTRRIGNNYYDKIGGQWIFSPTLAREPKITPAAPSPYTVVSLYYGEWQTPGQSYNKTPWGWFTDESLMSERLPLFAKSKDFKPLLLDYSNPKFRDYSSAGNATLTKNQGSVTLTATGIDPILNPGFPSIDGAKVRYIKVVVSRLEGSAWDGTAYYSTGGHGVSASFRKSVAEPLPWAGPKTLIWDMHNLSVGGNDWQTNTISSIRLDLGASTADVFEIFSIELLDVNGDSIVTEIMEHDPAQPGAFALEQRIAYKYGIDVFSSCFYWDGSANFQEPVFKQFCWNPERDRPKFCVMWAISSGSSPISGPFGTANGVPDLTEWYKLIDHWHDNYFGSDKYWFKGGKPVVMAFLGGHIRVAAGMNYGFLTSKVVTSHTAGTNVITLPDTTGLSLSNYLTGTGVTSVSNPIFIQAINGNNITVSRSVATSLTGVSIAFRDPSTVTATTNLLTALNNRVMSRPNSKAPNGIHWTSLNDNPDHPDFFGKVAGSLESYTQRMGFGSAGTYNFFDGYVGQTQFDSAGRSSGSTAGYNFRANYLAAGKDPNTFAYQMDLYDNVLTYAANSGTTIPYFASVIAGWEKTPWTFFSPLAVTSASWDNGVATFNTASPHSVVNGDKVTTKDFVSTDADSTGSFNFSRQVATSTGPSQFTVQMPVNPGTYVSGGFYAKDPDSAHRGAKLAQFRSHLERTKAIMDAAPASGTDKTILIYAWNEFGEGGFICPTRQYGYGMLEAVRDTFGKRPVESDQTRYRDQI